jgi:hypothetical protein
MHSFARLDPNGETRRTTESRGESLKRVLEPSDFVSASSPSSILIIPEADGQPDLPVRNGREILLKLQLAGLASLNGRKLKTATGNDSGPDVVSMCI